MNARELIDALSSLPDLNMPIQVYSQFSDVFIPVTSVTIENGIVLKAETAPTSGLVVRLR